MLVEPKVHNENLRFLDLFFFGETLSFRKPEVSSNEPMVWKLQVHYVFPNVFYS